MRRPQRRHTPRRPSPQEFVTGEDYYAARLFRRLEMRLILACGDPADEQHPAPQAQGALSRARREAARTRDWRKRVAAIERAATNVFGSKAVEGLRTTLPQDRVSPERRQLLVESMDQRLGRANNEKGTR